MDALGSLEEIAEQTSFRVNAEARQRPPRCKWGSAVPPNLARAKVMREKSAPVQAAKPHQKPGPKDLPRVVAARLGQTISTYQILVETFRRRADELKLSRSEIDRIAGLPSGYAGKVLSLGKAGKQKRMGMVSLENILAALGLKIILIEDEAAAARTLAVRTPVDSRNQRFGNVSRLTPKHPGEISI